MKQKVSFFSTGPAQFIKEHGSFIIVNLTEAFIGGIWVGFLWLFIMFVYQLRTNYRKAILEDRKECKVMYRDLSKRSRKIAAAFAIFLMISVTLLCVEEDMFL